MMNFFRKYKRIIFTVTLLVFLASIFFAGSSFYIARSYNTVASVNGTKILYEAYQKTVERVLSNLREDTKDDKPITDEMVETKKQEVLRDLIQEEVFSQLAKKYGIAVSDNELAADIQRYPAFQKDGIFDQQTYIRALIYAIHATPEEFEESQRKSIMMRKLRQFVLSGVKVTDGELRHIYAAEKNGDLSKFAEERESYLETYRNKKASQILQDWYTSINADLKVKTYLDKIENRMQNR
ncbi:MAG: SurA N-terminal domain-containing protein [bacterium]